MDWLLPFRTGNYQLNVEAVPPATIIDRLNKLALHTSYTVVLKESAFHITYEQPPYQQGNISQSRVMASQMDTVGEIRGAEKNGSTINYQISMSGAWVAAIMVTCGGLVALAVLFSLMDLRGATAAGTLLLHTVGFPVAALALAVYAAVDADSRAQPIHDLLRRLEDDS
jgi:hypothetical protein